MDERSRLLLRNIAVLARARSNRYLPGLRRDRTLQSLIAQLVAARTAAGMTQEQVALKMWTTKSAISRLESGVRTRPSLRTIQRYALAVGADVEIRIRSHFTVIHTGA